MNQFLTYQRVIVGQFVLEARGQERQRGTDSTEHERGLRGDVAGPGGDRREADNGASRGTDRGDFVVRREDDFE